MNQNTANTSAESEQDSQKLSPLLIYKIKFPEDCNIIADAGIFLDTNGKSCNPIKDRQLNLRDVHFFSPNGDKRFFINPRSRDLNNILVFTFNNIEDVNNIEAYPNNVLDCFKQCQDVYGWDQSYIDYRIEIFKVDKDKIGQYKLKYFDITNSTPTLIIKK
jgi:hypothetical protein